jgi:hypothetical protein
MSKYTTTLKRLRDNNACRTGYHTVEINRDIALDFFKYPHSGEFFHI